MDFPPVEPWTELSDERFFHQVLEARQVQANLLDLSVDELSDFVSSNLPDDVRWMDQPPDYPPVASKRLRRVTYASVIHNRSDVFAEPGRIADICRALLHDPFVDGLAKAVLVPVGVAGDMWVDTGNHRLIAQQLLGIGPWALVLE